MEENNNGRYSPDKLRDLCIEAFTSKEAELNHEFTKEELITLCQRKKCTVQMDLWNPIYEFYWQLKRKGRLENKTPEKITKLLKRLGNRYKNDPKRSYSRKQIDSEREIEWKLRKCYHVRWLKENKENFCENLSTSEERNSQNSVVTVIRSQSPFIDVVGNNSNAVPNYMNHLNYDPSEIVGREEVVLDTENLDNTEENDPSTSISKVNDSLSKLENAVDDIIGTQSILNVFTDTEPLLLYDGNAESYEDFHVFVPATSTQSQEK